MNGYRVSGRFLMGDRMMEFSKEVATDTEEMAKEYIYSVMGSRHGTKRRKIFIDSIEELKPEEITDQVVRYRLGVDK